MLDSQNPKRLPRHCAHGPKIVIAGGSLAIICDCLGFATVVMETQWALSIGHSGPVYLPDWAIFAIGGVLCLCFVGCVIMAAVAIKWRRKGKAAVLGGVLLVFHMLLILRVSTRRDGAFGCIGPILILVGGIINSKIEDAS